MTGYAQGSGYFITMLFTHLYNTSYATNNVLSNVLIDIKEKFPDVDFTLTKADKVAKTGRVINLRNGKVDWCNKQDSGFVTQTIP